MQSQVSQKKQTIVRQSLSHTLPDNQPALELAGKLSHQKIKDEALRGMLKLKSSGLDGAEVLGERKRKRNHVCRCYGSMSKVHWLSLGSRFG